MAKKLIILVLVLLVAAAAYFGVLRYQATHLSAEQTVTSFIDQTVHGDTTKTYGQFTPSLKKQVSESEWGKFVTFYKDHSAKPKLEKHEQIKDSFNTYPKGSQPQRFIYIFDFNGDEYQMLIVTYKQGSSWKIDELQGNYR